MRHISYKSEPKNSENLNQELKSDIMEKLKDHGVMELTNDELTELSGGGFWIGVVGAVAVHLALEAYNDWEAHVEAFNNGRASAQK